MQLKYHMVTIKDLVPDHSMISPLRRRKPGLRKVFRRLFEEVVRQCAEKGLVSGKLMATDSAYDCPLAHRVLEDQGIAFSGRSQSAHDHTNVELKRDAFSWPENYCGCIRRTAAPAGRTGSARRKKGLPKLPAAGKVFEREGQTRRQKAGVRQRHLARRYGADCREALKKRQIWCKGVFAAQKWAHLTRVLRRDLEAAEDCCLLSATLPTGPI